MIALRHLPLWQMYQSCIPYVPRTQSLHGTNNCDLLCFPATRDGGGAYARQKGGASGEERHTKYYCSNFVQPGEHSCNQANLPISDRPRAQDTIAACVPYSRSEPEHHRGKRAWDALGRHEKGSNVVPHRGQRMELMPYWQIRGPCYIGSPGQTTMS